MQNYNFILLNPFFYFYFYSASVLFFKDFITLLNNSSQGSGGACHMGRHLFISCFYSMFIQYRNIYIT